MKNTTRKLFALNLALLLACSLLPLPALALETDTLLPEETFFMEAGAACERTLTARSNGLGDAEPAQPAGEPETQSEGEDVVTLSGTGYTISLWEARILPPMRTAPAAAGAMMRKITPCISAAIGAAASAPAAIW